MQTNNPRGKTERKNGSSKVQNFVVQGSILAAAGIIVRLIGMVYRIPLIDIIGQEGNGYYTSAYSVYSILLIISSYSLPTAVSKMVAGRLAVGQYRNSSRILKAAFLYATIVGGAAAFILWFGAGFFAELLGMPFCRYAIRHVDGNLFSGNDAKRNCGFHAGNGVFRRYVGLEGIASKDGGQTQHRRGGG